MKPLRSRTARLVAGAVLCALLQGLAPAMAAGKDAKEGKALPAAKVPEDLIANEHVREEFGINEFTTPSIRKIFDQLDALGTLSYDGLKRPLPDKAPSD